MGLIQIFQQEADIATGQSLTLPYDFKDKRSLPKGKNIGDKIIITPITVRTWFKIKPLLLSIDKKDLTKLIKHERENLTPDCAEVMAKYDRKILDIICYGIHNKASEPPMWFRELLIDNSTWQDLAILFNAIIFRINSLSFCSTITTAVNVSPLSETEIIALERNIKSWTPQ